MEYFNNHKNASITLALIDAIHENAAYLSEVDGETGDGDHGVNMNKGFLLAKERISEDDSFTDSLKTLGRTLVMDIGGSMGPIYGTMFTKLSKSLKGCQEITAEQFMQALDAATQALMDLAGAQPGDKTLVDTILPAAEAFRKANDNGEGFAVCLDEMKAGAQAGKESTKEMVAKIGRAARLGERSKGHYDAGAVSCCIILSTMADGVKKTLQA